jgi:hypothetical protein
MIFLKCDLLYLLFLYNLQSCYILMVPFVFRAMVLLLLLLLAACCFLAPSCPFVYFRGCCCYFLNIYRCGGCCDFWGSFDLISFNFAVWSSLYFLLYSDIFSLFASLYFCNAFLSFDFLSSIFFKNACSSAVNIPDIIYIYEFLSPYTY